MSGLYNYVMPAKAGIQKIGIPFRNVDSGSEAGMTG
jgi:hypothetical protein